MSDNSSLGTVVMSGAEPEQSAWAEFRRGWPIILAASIGIGLGLSPVPFYTIGMLAPELSAEFGWNIGDIMAGIAVMTVSALIASPIAGNLTDRFGVRRVALSSIILFALAFASFSLGNGSLLMFYMSWGLIAFAGAGTLPITWTRTVNVWFEKKKGLALGLSLVGTGLFGAMLKPITAALIAEFGWRTTYLVIACFPLFIAFPIAFFLFKEHPSESASKIKHEPSHKALPYEGMDFISVLKDMKFWLIIISVIPISFAIAGPIPNMENLLVNKGFSLIQIASIVPLIGISVLVGRTLGGFLIDYFWAPGVAFVLLTLPIAACWMLGHLELTIVSAMVAVFLIGFASGVEYDLIAFLIARYFGMKNYSTIFGFVYGAFALGAGVGPMVFGMIFDKTASYTSILNVSAVILLIGAAMLLMLGKYRYTQE